ncbi:MAG: hypothetical protein QOI60_948 [Actinomycetota bacterium]|nr:hypothetical protein [Actinomycetota bacterium]
MFRPAHARRAAILMMVPMLLACTKSVGSTSATLSASPSGGASGRGDSAAVYVHAFCMSLDNWVTSVKDRSADIRADVAAANTLVKRRTQAVKYFGDLAGLTGRLVNHVIAEGPPNVDGGEATHAVLVNTFLAAQQIFADARTSAKSFPVDKAKAFKKAFNSSLDALKSASGRIVEALSSLSGGSLDAATAADPVCQTIGQ